MEMNDEIGDSILDLLKQTEKKRDETQRLLAQLKEQVSHLKAAAASAAGISIPGDNSARYRGTLGMAEAVLRANGGREMHAKEIAEKILQQFGVKVRHQSVGSQLWRASKKTGSPFYRGEERNTYGIR